MHASLFIRARFSWPFWKAIRHEVQSHVVLKQSFEAREHRREPLSRVRHIIDKLVAVARPARLGDADEGGAVLLRRKLPFHSRAATVFIPLDHDALIRFDHFHNHLRRDVLHLPFPFDLLASFESATALGKPEPGRNRWVDERLKHIGDRLADEHPGLCNWRLFKLKIVDIYF